MEMKVRRWVIQVGMKLKRGRMRCGKEGKDQVRMKVRRQRMKVGMKVKRLRIQVGMKVRRQRI